MELREILPALREAGGDLAVVGNGWPAMAADARATFRLDVPFLVDPERKVYEALGLERGVTKTFSVRAVGRVARFLKDGHRQKGVQGDPWQLGGALVLAPDGRVLLEQRSRFTGDHVAPGELVAAIRRA